MDCRFKDWTFREANHLDKTKDFSSTRHVYNAEWAPRKPNKRVEPCKSAVRQAPPTLAKNMMKAGGSLSAFMLGSRARAEACVVVGTTTTYDQGGDDLDLYLNFPDAEIDIDVQDWWCKNATIFPSCIGYKVLLTEDIWGENGKALFVLCTHWMDENFDIRTRVLLVKPCSSISHTCKCLILCEFFRY